MQPHEQRVVDEYEALNVKIKALDSFFINPAYFNIPQHDKDLLMSQSDIMLSYSNILHARIKLFL